MRTGKGDRIRIRFVTDGVRGWRRLVRGAAHVCTLALLPLLLPHAGCVEAGPAPNPADPGAGLPVGRRAEQESWPNGGPRLRAEMRVEPDGTKVLDGQYTLWFLTGQKQYEATYVDGRLHGMERQWHENGQLRVEQQYSHGLRQGPRYDWDPSGRLRKEERYDHDQPHGTWSVWDGKGALKWQGRFEHGKPLP